MRAFVASAIPLLSASQITLYRECARKWAWRYIAKIQTPQHPSAALGTEVDDTQLQPYLRDGRPFDYTRESGYIAAAGLAFLPKPKTPGMEVQKHFVLPSPFARGAFAYQGYMDLWLPDSGLVPDMPGGAPFVGDFKTTSDLKWAKSEQALSTDVQAMLYSTYAIYLTKAKFVDLSWMYFQTRGAKKTRRTYLRVTSEHVVEQFKDIEETAGEMFAAREFVTDPLKLPPSPSQCEAYGGCPYRDKCNLSPSDHLAALAARDTALSELKGLNMSDATTSLMANLAARRAKAPLGINPPEKDLPVPPAPEAAPASPPAEPPPAAKRGRPRKVPPFDPVGADAAAATAPVGERQMPLPFPSNEGLKELAVLVVDEIVRRLGGK